MISKNTVNQIIENYLENTGYYLVDLNISQDNRITVEVDSFEGVSLDFCIELNKYIESQLDRDIEDFELEVSSAGLTAPFKVVKQYEKNIGKEVEVLTKDGKKLTGIISSVQPESFILQIEKTIKPEGAKRKTTVQESTTFNYSDLKYTKYIIRFK
ncbi:MAG: ribosome assembly cofactor RimP [Paludibacter sp.]|nr:ribosome assembly cofactor RimP [Paludibacter sp.]